MRTSLYSVVLYIVMCYSCFAQVDLSNHVKRVYEGEKSTTLSIFNTNPESPNGRYLAYLKYKEIVKGDHRGPEVEAYLMIKERETAKTTEIATVHTTNHNGANALWVNDTLITCQIEHLQDFEIFNVKSGNSIHGRIRGELGHDARNNLIYFSRSNERLMELHKNRKPFNTSEEGIWTLDIISGKERQIVGLHKVENVFKQQNPDINNDRVQLLHVTPSPNGSKILFDYRHFKNPDDKKRKQLKGYVNLDGTDLRWVPKRPIHLVWLDENSFTGIDLQDDKKYVKRYDTYGNFIEISAGSSCHLGVSPDNQWLSGEFGYYWHEKDGFTRVYLYKNKETTPTAILAKWQKAKITWKWKAYVNPSFSSDGERIYFIRAVDGEDKFEAVYINLKETEILI